MLFGMKNGSLYDFDDISPNDPDRSYNTRIDYLKTIATSSSSSGGAVAGLMRYSNTVFNPDIVDYASYGNAIVIVPKNFPDLGDNFSPSSGTIFGFYAYTDSIDESYHEVFRGGTKTYVDGIEYDGYYEIPSTWANLGQLDFKNCTNITIINPSRSSKQYYCIYLLPNANSFVTELRNYEDSREMFGGYSSNDCVVKYTFWPNTLIRRALNTVNNIAKQQSELYVAR